MASRSIFTSFLLLYVLGFDEVLTKECISPLGMADRRIKDSQITVSSFIKKAYGGQARLRQNIPPWGGWCPNQSGEEGKDEKNYDQYIEIDLLNLTKITRIATQGREYSKGKELVEDYKLSYSEEGGLWHYYKETDQTLKIFPGNTTNVSDVMQHYLDPAIMARYIRVHPGYYYNVNQICMRLELYGCVINSENVILSYSAPAVGQTTKTGGKITYADNSYTGQIIKGFYKNGIGILTDGKFGFANAKEEGWVGWNANFTRSQYIDIIFEFSGVRKFKDVTLTVNVDKKRDHAVFNRSQIFFSSTENNFLNTTFLQCCPRDYPAKNDPYNANVTLSLCESTARFIKLRLYFGGLWLLITEISFNSVPTSIDEKMRDCSENTTSSSTTPTHGCGDCTTSSTGTDFKIPAKTSSGLSNLHLTIIIVCVILLIVLSVEILLLYRRRALCFGKMTQRNKTPRHDEPHRVEDLQTADMQNERSQDPEAIQNNQEPDYRAADNVAYEVEELHEATEAYEEVQISPPSVYAQLDRNLQNGTDNCQKWLKCDPGYAIPAHIDAKDEMVGKIQSFPGYTELDNTKRVHDDSACYQKLLIKEPDYSAASNETVPYEEIQISPPSVSAQLDKNRQNETNEDNCQKWVECESDYVIPADTDAKDKVVGKIQSFPGYTELDNTKRVHDDSAFYQKLLIKEPGYSAAANGPVSYEEVQISPPSVSTQLDRNQQNETDEDNCQKWLKYDPDYVIPADTDAKDEVIGKIQSAPGYTELDNTKRVHDDGAFYQKLIKK